MALTKIGKEGVAGISNSSDATAITISSGEVVTLADDLIIKDSGTIGSASKTDAITIASSGLGQLTSTGIGAGSQVLQVIDDGATLFQIRSEDGNVSFPQAGAGIYLGVTSGNSANLLDDYEEGTFTPTVQNATGYSAQFGTYKKIGHLVFVNANITVTSASGSTHEIRGLPFTSKNTGNSAGNLSIGYYSDVNTAMVWLSGYVLNASTNVYISGNSAGHTGATIQHNGPSMFKTSGNSRVMFSVVYEAA